MSEPKISIIMPVYNTQDYLAEAIESVLDQTFYDFELIIVDDDSSDKTLNIAKKYAKKDERIKIIKNEINKNIGASLNNGIYYSSAKIIARMDGDDISMPTRLEKQYKLLSKNKELAVVGCNMITIDEEGNEIGRRSYTTDSEALKKKMFRYSPFAHPSTMYRKEVFQESGGYNPALSPTEDLDLWMKIGRKYELSNVPEYLFKYRVYKRSSSHKRLRNVEIKVLLIRIYAVFFYGYRPSFIDVLYNAAQFITVFFMPTKFRYKLFNFLRSNNLI